MPTPHIGAQPGDFAKVVLLPGDPYRAKYIVENYLHDYVLVTEIRGILGYTGYTENGKRISVIASGMGQPSLAIYVNELYDHYGVETIIRVGTAGSYQPYVHIRDLVLVSNSSTDSSMSNQLDLWGGTLSASPTYEVLEASVNVARELGLPFHVGGILSADTFYNFDPSYWEKWQKAGCLCVEMESYALFMLAQMKRKKAGCILTISDSFCEKGILAANERQEGLATMIKVGILTAEKFA
ncbi:MAG: purine-nucleoside phosphorylase [Bacilli bacterium]|nr:purine-nucleoside phosphorylase [Bacilli bacterium]